MHASMRARIDMGVALVRCARASSTTLSPIGIGMQARAIPSRAHRVCVSFPFGGLNNDWCAEHGLPESRPRSIMRRIYRELLDRHRFWQGEEVREEKLR